MMTNSDCILTRHLGVISIIVQSERFQLNNRFSPNKFSKNAAFRCPTAVHQLHEIGETDLALCIVQAARAQQFGGKLPALVPQDSSMIWALLLLVSRCPQFVLLGQHLLLPNSAFAAAIPTSAASDCARSDFLNNGRFMPSCQPG